MTDDLEKKLRAIQNHPARSEAEKETHAQYEKRISELEAAIQKPKAEAKKPKKTRIKQAAQIDISKLDAAFKLFLKQHQEKEVNFDFSFTKQELYAFLKYLPKDLNENGDLYSHGYGFVSSETIDPAGYFIASAINKIAEKGDVFELDLSGLEDYKLCGLGYRLNGAKLEIRGDVGHMLGKQMQQGEIVLHGSAGSNVGTYMINGKITVTGDVKDNTGYMMEGGEIHIGGNAGSQAGLEMLGGKLVIHKNATDRLGKFMKNGTIIVHGNAGDGIGLKRSGGTITVNGRSIR